MKFLSPTAVITVQDAISHLNSNLMFGECVGDRMTLEVVLKY